MALQVLTSHVQKLERMLKKDTDCDVTMRLVQRVDVIEGRSQSMVDCERFTATLSQSQKQVEKTLASAMQLVHRFMEWAGEEFRVEGTRDMQYDMYDLWQEFDVQLRTQRVNQRLGQAGQTQRDRHGRLLEFCCTP
eukprot:TRINITY_DN60505_c0_g2_i1.p1 TRINITY_DN60505_c0_g2~~TRINITY_DN60505_c0_g2_i1.p1  ORF type:complete len:136 (-),score=25.35 TRINITY_DN60505_c0_g2_i1:68-475(-)